MEKKENTAKIDVSAVEKKIEKLKAKRELEERCNHEHNVMIFDYMISEFEDVRDRAS